MEYRLRRHDGEFRWILDRGTPRYLPDGTFAGYIGSCVDITERKQLEVDLRKAVQGARRVPVDRVARAAHAADVAASCARSGFTSRPCETAGEPGRSDAARLARDAEVALTQVLHLVRMVDVLLDVSRISEGPLALDRDDLDVGPLVAGVADRLKEPASTAGSPIRVEIRGAATARWDRFRIEQVVTNLLSNAIKYGAGKPVDIVVAPLAAAARASWSRIAAPASRRDTTAACSSASRGSRPPGTTAASAWGYGSRV